MRLVDTHCHLNFDRYDEDRDAVIHRAHEAGVAGIVIPAEDMQSTESALRLAADHDGIYASVGVHPNSTLDFNEHDLGSLRELATRHGVVAIGEIGLDYYWDKVPAQQQKLAFQAQLELAGDLELPVIIHNRDASEDVISMLEAWVSEGLPRAIQSRPGVLHSFSAPQEIADRALDIGFYIGLTGPLTFKKADELRTIARRIPNDKLLVETDGPFLTPEPYRGKRNEPAYVAYVVDRLAGLKGLSTEKMAEITTQNAETFFGVTF
jgi:TatD DNase family protein